MIEGRVKYGINNIFVLQSGDEEIECRIKGKILGEGKTEYNPLAPGDIVLYERDPVEPGKGMILRRLNRENVLTRWNKKRKCPQALAANVDQVVCISSPVSPAFRPRFIDRVLIAAAIGGIPSLILVNKEDQGISREIADRLNAYKAIDVPSITCSARDRTNIGALERALRGKITVFVGQSGVGKSTLLNIFSREPQQRTGGVSEKYNKGTHTTCFSTMITCSQNTYIVDTPGIREIDVCGINASELDRYFPEFLPYIEQCALSRCTHLHEPGCGVLTALASGSIHPDRFESYRRMFARLEELMIYHYG
jgi:ribosome biogenesis GTPase